jgi:uncharacterized damage-inducible protein DinB
MNVEAFRHLYDYHFSENRKIWESARQLAWEQFTGNVDYSRGSVRDQVVHLIGCDETWFSELQGIEPLEDLPAADGDDREVIRIHWDNVERRMRHYLLELQDDMLLSRPIREPEEDSELLLWQVLIHVVNHGTDHRAQVLRVLNNLGVKTTSQDYIFYAYDHSLNSG